MKDKEEKFQQGTNVYTRLTVSFVEMTRVAAVHKTQQSQIKLDVGGTHYTTSISTLTRIPNSMLEAMFSGRHSIHKNDEGRVFIDRNGKLFEYILDYLRNGEWDFPKDDSLLAKLNREINYFGLELEEEVEECEKWVFANHPEFGIGKKWEFSNNGTTARCNHGAPGLFASSVLGNIELKKDKIYYWEIKVEDMNLCLDIGILIRIFFEYLYSNRNC